MSINLITKNFLYEIGSGDFLIAFFDTIDVRLTKGLFKKSYPYTLEEFYNGHISYEHLDGLESELKIIRKKALKSTAILRSAVLSLLTDQLVVSHMHPTLN